VEGLHHTQHVDVRALYDLSDSGDAVVVLSKCYTYVFAEEIVVAGIAPGW